MHHFYTDLAHEFVIEGEIRKLYVLESSRSYPIPIPSQLPKYPSMNPNNNLSLVLQISAKFSEEVAEGWRGGEELRAGQGVIVGLREDELSKSSRVARSCCLTRMENASRGWSRNEQNRDKNKTDHCERN